MGKITVSSRTHCCRPLPKQRKQGKCNTLGNLSPSESMKIIEMTGHNPLTSKICRKCRSYMHVKWMTERLDDELPNQSAPNNESGILVNLEPDVIIMEEENNEELFVTNNSNNLVELNKLLQFIGTEKCRPNVFKLHAIEREKEAERICADICYKIFNIKKICNYNTETAKESQYFKEIIRHLKDKYNSSTTAKSEKFQILTLAPQSWTDQQIADNFGVTTYIANQVKSIVAEKGILATQPKAFRTKNNNAKDKIIDFYKDDQISRQMGGIKDVIRIKLGEDKVPKRLMIYTINEAYNMFKIGNPELKVSISKFYTLRPKECVLPNSNGTHKICLCAIHQNVELLLKAVAKLPFDVENNALIESTNHYVNKIMCFDPNIQCFLRECIKCKDVSEMKTNFLTVLEENLEEQITFKQWMSTDRCDLEVIMKPINQFVDYFFDKLEKFVFHQHVAKKQSEYLKSRKQNLKVGEVLVIGDFSENFSFLHAHEVQSYHWSNKQCTIHPFVLYFLDGSLNLQHTSFTIISDDLRHDSTAVHLFITLLMKFIKANVIANPTNIIYFSDGAGSQYKNKKNFLNLRLHEKDFEVKAEWHFFATSHGKGASDGIGGSIKRMARDEVLRKGYSNTIVDARTLYEWLLTKKEKNKEIKLNFAYSTIGDYDAIAEILNIRFKQYCPLAVKGTHKFHSFVPSANSENKIDVRYLSGDNNCVFTINIFK